MLTNTFIHIPGVGPTTEGKLWASGIRTWQDYLQAYPDVPTVRVKQEIIRDYLLQSEVALAAHDHRFFARHLSSRDHWRAYPEFADSIAYLDIETTGMGAADDVTMVGVYNGTIYRGYIHGIDLHEFPIDISQVSFLVTFFGSCFDLPVLCNHFTSLRFDQLHVDLCHVMHRLGYRGGLKKIEEQLGISRSEGTTGLSGFDAVRLWWEYKRGSRAALETLVQYNMEDVVNLQYLMQFSYRTLRGKLGFATSDH